MTYSGRVTLHVCEIKKSGPYVPSQLSEPRILSAPLIRIFKKFGSSAFFMEWVVAYSRFGKLYRPTQHQRTSVFSPTVAVVSSEMRVSFLLLLFALSLGMYIAESPNSPNFSFVDRNAVSIPTATTATDVIIPFEWWFSSLRNGVSVPAAAGPQGQACKIISPLWSLLVTKGKETNNHKQLLLLVFKML